jgi:hypothetical protein
MSLELIVILALVMFGSGFGTAWKVDEWRHDAADTARVVAAEKAQAAADARAAEIADRFEDKLAKIKIVNTTVNRETTHELQSRVYTDCKLPESGRVLINTYADDVNAALGFSPIVPAHPPVGKLPGNDGGSVPARPDFDAAIQRLRSTSSVTPRAGTKALTIPK